MKLGDTRNTPRGGGHLKFNCISFSLINLILELKLHFVGSSSLLKYIIIFISTMSHPANSNQQKYCFRFSNYITKFQNIR